MLILPGASIFSGAEQILIGALISQSGDAALVSPGIEAAVNFVISDLNDSYKKAGLDITATVLKAGIDGTKEIVANATGDLLSQDVQAIVGPPTSGEMQDMLPILTRDRIVSVNLSTSVSFSRRSGCQALSLRCPHA